MCVIATKSLGAVLPDEATLRRCFSSNPDGAGFAFSTTEKVFWRKGFTTFEAFYAALKEVFPTEDAEKASACVMHFRIGTHGPKKSPTHTHPFPVDAETIQGTCALEGSSKMVLFHNGIIHDMTSVPHDKVLVDGKPEEPSDSQILTQYFVNPMFTAYRKGIFTATTFNNFMFSLIGSCRIALLQKNGVVTRYGTWEKDDADYPGCFFSNASYKKPATIVESSYYADYDDNWEDSRPIYGTEYWRLHDDYFKHHVGATQSQFLVYYNEYIKTRESLKKEEKRKNKSSKDEVTYTPFWETHSKFGFQGNYDRFVKLPVGTEVTVDKNYFVTYDPSIDGDVYSWPTYTGRTSNTTYLYVKETKDGKEEFYYLGSYKIKLPSKGGTANATDIKLLKSPKTKAIM